VRRFTDQFNRLRRRMTSRPRQEGDDLKVRCRFSAPRATTGRIDIIQRGRLLSQQLQRQSIDDFVARGLPMSREVRIVQLNSNADTVKEADNSQQAPVRHHFTPVFYLGAWAVRGRITRYYRPKDVVVASPIAPKTPAMRTIFTLCKGCRRNSKKSSKHSSFRR
jgi:hypothetical protein